MKRILLIEDDSSLGRTLQERLQKETYEVCWAETVANGRVFLKERSFDLIILDVKLPDGSGFELASEIKKNFSAPLIFVSAMTSAAFRLKGYELGAEEYIPKPFHLKELLLRVKHVLLNHSNEKILRIGDLIIDFEKRSIGSRDSSPEFLGTREFGILKLLIDLAPKVVSRDEILDKVWGDETFPSSRTVDNVIVRLRALLRDDKASTIRSVRGVGYQWLGDK